MNILVSEDIRTVCPEFVGAALEAHITNTPYSAPLWGGNQGVPNRLLQEIHHGVHQGNASYTSHPLRL